MAAINYWEDDWEEQVKASQAESWEDLADEQVSTCQTHVEDDSLKSKGSDTDTKSVWSKPNTKQNRTPEYTKEYPTIKNESVNHQTEKQRVMLLNERTKDNIFEALNEETHIAQEPTKVNFIPPKPLAKGITKEHAHRKPPMKSRFCKDGANCSRGNRCWWAHSERELVPERCNRGQNCRCIFVNHNKEVFNNSRSRRVCMYRHDERYLDGDEEDYFNDGYDKWDELYNEDDKDYWYDRTDERETVSYLRTKI
jgi:hypothetical protein